MTSTTEQAAAHGEVALGALLEQLGVDLLQIVVAPAGLDVGVRGIVLHDAADEHPLERGVVVLAIGVDERGTAAAGLIDAAGEAGAAAVVLKRHGEVPETLAERARQRGVALLAVSSHASWGQLYTLLRTAEATAGAPGDGVLGGAPVGDLFALANAVAAMVGGAITIEDPRSNVLAYSTSDAPIDVPRRRTILGRAVPEDWTRVLQEQGVFQRLWSADGPIRVRLSDFGDVNDRLAIAVRAGDQILGSMWALEGNHPFGSEAEQALASAAPVAALHLVRHYARDDLRRRDDSELLRAVLGAHLPPEQLAAAGLRADGHVTVLGFELVSDDVAAATAGGERIEGLMALYLQAYRYDAVCAALEGRVYVVVADAEPPAPERLLRLATGLVDNVRRGPRMTLRGAIGGTVAGLGGVLASRRDADSVLRVLAEDGHAPAVAALDAVRSRVILAELRDLAQREPAVLRGKLDRLREDDERGRTQHIATLRAYLDAFGDASRAARLLDVHPNTYRYRLRRALEIAELDLDDPLERLVAHLQLHLLPDGE
jgi:hypothetical protein